MAIVAEMAGIPGAGKTTFHELLRQQLGTRDEGRTVLGSDMVDEGSLPRVRTMLRQSRSMFRYRRALFCAVRILAAGARPRREKTQALRFLFVTLDRYEQARRLDRSKIVLLDEGVVQRCFLLFVESTGVDGTALEAFLAACPSPDAVIYLDTDACQAIERVNERLRGFPERFSGLDHGQLVAVLDAGRDLLQEAIHLSGKLRGAVAFELPSDGSHEAAEVANCLVELLSRPEGRDVAPRCLS